MERYGNIRFSPKQRTNFYITAKKRIDQYFEEQGISSNADATMYLKTVILLSAYFMPFALILFLQPGWWALLLWALMGFAMAGIGMSIMHDANHGAYSSNETVNYILGHTLTFIGGSVFNWKLQHNKLHHTFTNITFMDDDIADKALLKLSPHTPLKAAHRYQNLFCIGLYSIATLYWVFVKDFMQIHRYTKFSVNKNSPKDNVYALIRLIVSKVAYIFIMLVMPTLFFNIPFVQVITGFVLLHLIGGVVLTVVFQLAHTVDGTEHPMPDSNRVIENDWALHQMATTVNFSPNNKWLSWYVGGLNYQVEHHLFPKVCHVHYPEIAPILKQTAAEFNVPYLENKTFAEALSAHFSALKRFGTIPQLETVLAG